MSASVLPVLSTVLGKITSSLVSQFPHLQTGLQTLVLLLRNVLRMKYKRYRRSYFAKLQAGRTLKFTRRSGTDVTWRSHKAKPHRRASA